MKSSLNAPWDTYRPSDIGRDHTQAPFQTIEEEQRSTSDNLKDADKASLRILELSKALREAQSQSKNEQSKCKYLLSRVQVLEQKILNNGDQGRSSTTPAASPSDNLHTSANNEDDRKVLHEKLTAMEMNLVQVKNQNHQMKNELKLVKNAVEAETGEKISNLTIWLKTKKFDWKNKHQQIAALKSRNKALQLQLEQEKCQHMIDPCEDWNKKCTSDFEVHSHVSGATTFGIEMLDMLKQSPDDAESSKIPKLIGERNRLKSTISTKNLQLERDNSEMKSELDALRQKFHGLKSREKVLLNDISRLREQTETLLQKSKNDDELVEKLLGENQILRSTLKFKDAHIHDKSSELQRDIDKHISEKMQAKLQVKNLEVCCG